MAEVEIPQLSNDSGAQRVLVRGSTTSGSKDISPKTEEPIVKEKAVKKELSFGQKLRGAFVKEDLTSIRDYVVFDIIVPSVKQSIFDTVTGIVGQLLGVNISTRATRGYSGGNDRPFKDYAKASRRGSVAHEKVQQYDPYDVSDVIFKSKADALALLEEIIDICDTNGWYSVDRFYRRAGIPEINNGYTNQAYGWHNVDGSEVVAVHGGYIIDLPRARTR